jgi:hypothetical protein
MTWSDGLTVTALHETILEGVTTATALNNSAASHDAEMILLE